MGTAELPGLDELLEEAPEEIQAVFETVDQGSKAYPIWLMGSLSGLTYGAGVVFDDLVNLVKNFKEVALQLLQMAAVFVEHPELLWKIPGMLGEAVVAAQEIQNPFPGTGLPSLAEFDLDVRHTLFAAGWYVGGLVGLIGGELLFGLGIGSLVKGLAHVSTTVARWMRTYRGAKLFLKGKAIGAAKWVYEAAGSGLRYLDSEVVIPALDRLTAGKQAVVVRLLDDVPASTRKPIADLFDCSVNRTTVEV